MPTAEVSNLNGVNYKLKIKRKKNWTVHLFIQLLISETKRNAEINTRQHQATFFYFKMKNKKRKWTYYEIIRFRIKREPDTSQL